MSKNDDVFEGLVIAVYDILKEIVALRKDKAKIRQNVDLSSSGITVCPKCGAIFEASKAQCDYCGYISAERDKMLEIVRIRERSTELQIEYDQQQLKKVVLLLGILVIPVIIALVGMLAFSIIGATIGA